MRNQIMWYNVDSFYRPSRSQNMGYAITYNMATGELSKADPVDVGFKWNRIHKDFETRLVWYLTLGHAF